MTIGNISSLALLPFYAYIGLHVILYSPKAWQQLNSLAIYCKFSDQITQIVITASILKQKVTES
jgi:hypothetical protein